MTHLVDRITTLVAGRTDEGEEQQLLELLTRASREEINAVLETVEAHHLFESLDDRTWGPDSRTALTELLARTRRSELSHDAAASVIYALQRGRTTTTDEEAIRDIILATAGEDLTRLKNQINMRTDVHDLEGLVFGDIDSEDVREEILRHIAVQAAVVDAHEAKVLSDIDDTVFCKLKDRRYPRGTLYPGVLALQQELDHGPDAEPFSVGDLTFVTARPADAFGLIENSTKQALRTAGIATSTVLSGSFLAVFTHDAMAGKKLLNMDHYHQLFPEYTMVFLGDSGQGDVAVGQEMWQRWPDHVKGVFIHDVVDTPQADRQRYAAEHVYFHDTYVGCATKAHELDLITSAGLRRVIEESMAALDDIAWDTPEQEARMRDLFARDVAAAQPALR